MAHRRQLGGVQSLLRSSDGAERVRGSPELPRYTFLELEAEEDNDDATLGESDVEEEDEEEEGDSCEGPEDEEKVEEMNDHILDLAWGRMIDALRLTKMKMPGGNQVDISVALLNNKGIDGDCRYNSAAVFRDMVITACLEYNMTSK
jgi:hypothetical protein